MKNYLGLAFLALFAASAATAQPPGVPPGPPAVEIAGTVDANVVNTVDANVVNTVDANVGNIVDANVVNTVDANVGNIVETHVVNTIATDNLQGVDFFTSVRPGGTIAVSSVQPLLLRAISTSIASDAPATLCNVRVRVLGGVASEEPIGLSVMSNGQASTVSHTYDTPIGPLNTLIWEVQGDAVTCAVSLSMLGELDVETAAAARMMGSSQPMRIDVR